MPDLSAAAARRVAIAAQGLDRARPARPGPATIARTIERLGLLQIDSVNVLARAHYLPLFSRLGPYDRQALDRLAYRRRALFEYWAHEASLLPMDAWPLFGWRMQRARRYDTRWGIGEWARANAAYVEEVYRQVSDRGPVGVGDLDELGEKNGPWWGWPKGKSALEFLFVAGRVTVADRRNFERRYDVTERVIPAGVLELPMPAERDAHKALVARAAASLGIATVSDLADYYRLPGKVTAALVAELVEEGVVRQVSVEGWTKPAYLHAEARIPRRVAARALVAPFDPIVWERARTERIFGFRYRIEIYVPKPKRVYGYYVLPFLLGDRFAARVDLKADRAAGALLVQAAFAEHGVQRGEVCTELAQELRAMAGWLGLERVRVQPRGDLARELGKAVGRSG